MPFEETDDLYNDFNIWGGCCFLTCMVGPYSVPCFPCMYLRMTSQQVKFEGNRMHFTYDCLLAKEDKLIPLDRIQDANIEANCCARLCGISILNIQTANGSPSPEAVIIAPNDAHRLRSMIMDRRDQLVHGGSTASTGLDGVAIARSPVHDNESAVELKGIRGTLERIERLMEKGVEKFEKMDVR